MVSEELKEMFMSFTFKDNETYKVYHKKLTNSGLDEEIIKTRLNYLSNTWKPEYGRKIPSVSEIIGINIKDKETADYELAWQEFKKTCCNNYKFEPMKDWVYTLKQLIGVYEVEEMTPDSEKWVKKEFLRIIPTLRSGLIKLNQSDAKYMTSGNVTLLINDGLKNLLLKESEK